MIQYLFVDEAGCFTFERKPNVSRYFILCTVTMTDLSVSDSLRELRHDLVWEKNSDLGDYFHACTDTQEIRDKVFSTILPHEFHIQATIVEKSKAQPQTRANKARFYKYPWFYHFKHGISPHVKVKTPLLVTAASIGNRKEKTTFLGAITNVLSQTVSGSSSAGVDFRPCVADPCLQVADYCAWAIQRKYERNDERSYIGIKDRITYEYDLWSKGSKHYY
jgi:Protein of unknown function (DUF3800)